MSRPQLFGRSGSHFTRLVRIVALEAGVDLEFKIIDDFRSLDPAEYGGHPGLKLPTLVDGETRTFGAVTICRRLVEAAPEPAPIVWPEAMTPELQNAWELLSHAMLAQVQLVFGIIGTGLPADHLYCVKAAEGLQGSMTWLDERLLPLMAALPANGVSLFEAGLFCQLEHLSFRPTIPIAIGPRLEAFRETFAARPSALATPYFIDQPGAGS